MHPAMMFKEMKLLIQTQIRICLQSPICASSKFTSPTAEHCDNHSRANKQSKEKKIKNSKHKAISRVNSGLQNEPIPRYQGFI